MALYHYDKYHANSQWSGNYEGNWVNEGLKTMVLNHNVHTSYAFDKITGKFSNAGSALVVIKGQASGTYYQAFDSSVVRNIYSGETYEQWRRTVKQDHLGYSRGTLITTLIAEDGTYPTNGRHTDGYWYVRGELANTAPTLTLNTPNNATLYENDMFRIDGSAVESDIGDAFNVYYRINGGTSRAIAAEVSTGATLPFNEQLTLKGGALYKGGTAITGALSEGTAHRLEVWSEDNKGGKSTIHERTFYVVPNRAPTLTINPFDELSGTINNDKITISGTSFDLDGNDVIVRYRLNNASAVQVHDGPAGPWSFDLLLKDLKDGENVIVVEVTDTYNFKSSKTIKLNKYANLTPLSQSTQRYKITPPSGSAQGVLLWIQRHVDQEITAEISMTTGSEQEQFMPMNLTNTAPVDGFAEDEFTYQADSTKENIILKINLANASPVALISGVLS